jgi:hypothetical protein
MGKATKKGLANSGLRNGDIKRRESMGSAIIGIGAKDEKNMYTSAAVAISGITNWPSHVQDNEQRLQGSEDIPFMDLLIAGLDGSRASDIFGIMGKISNSIAIALDTVIFAEDDDRDFIFNKTHEIIAKSQAESIDSGEDVLDTPEKIAEHYSRMYPKLFDKDNDDKVLLVASTENHNESIGVLLSDEQSEKVEVIVLDSPRVSFHGATRQSITPKTKLRAKPNSKKGKFPDFRSSRKRHQTIRTNYLNQVVVEEEIRQIDQAAREMEKQASSQVVTM